MEEYKPLDQAPSNCAAGKGESNKTVEVRDKNEDGPLEYIRLYRNGGSTKVEHRPINQNRPIYTKAWMIIEVSKISQRKAGKERETKGGFCLRRTRRLARSIDSKQKKRMCSEIICLSQPCWLCWPREGHGKEVREHEYDWVRW